MTQVKVGTGTGNLGAITGGPIREDLENMVSNIDRSEAPFVDSIGKISAKNVLHEWLTDEYADPTKTLASEGTDFSSSTQTTRARLGNYTGIFREDVAVSGTAEAVDKAGVASEMSYQLKKATVEIMRRIDTAYTSFTNTVADGDEVVRSGSDPRRPGSIFSYAAAGNQDFLGSSVALTLDNGSGTALTGAANVTAATADPAVPSNYAANGTNYVRYSGTGANASRANIETLLTNMYNNGGRPNMVLAPSNLKVALSRLFGSDSTTAERRLQSMEKRVSLAVTGVISDFGFDLMMAPSYIMQMHSGANAAILFYQTDKVKRAQLRPTKTIKLDRGGDGFRSIVLCEETLVVENPNAVGFLQNVTG